MPVMSDVALFAPRKTKLSRAGLPHRNGAQRMTQQSALPTAQDAKRRLAVPDYINIGVFSALYFVIV